MQIEIMFGMLITILNKGKVTSNELSLKYEVSRRTILRYIDMMCAYNIPIISQAGRGGGFSIADNFTLNKMFFTKDELSRLIDCVNSMTELFNDKLTVNVKEKLFSLTYKEVNPILASDTIFIDSGPWGDIDSYKGKMKALQDSIKNNREISIVYHDAGGQKSSRIVWPHTLVFKLGIWYVYAFCTLRNQFRLFKIGRIANITLLNTVFTKKEIDLEALPYSLNWFDKEDNINIVLELEPSIRSEVEEWLSFENVIQTKNDIIYAFARLPENGLVQKLLSFGNKIKIVEPISLKEKLLKTIKGIEQLYGK